MESTYSKESFMEIIGNDLYKDWSKFNIFKRRNNFSRYKKEESILIVGDLSRKEPELSIVIPTYKRTEVLKDAVDSALNQRGFEDYEVIVVDNEGVWENDTDTEALMKSYSDNRLYYYKNKNNIGQRANWNRCLELARGKWICFLQNDDCLLDDCCKECMDIIHSDSKIQALSVKLNILVRSQNGNKRIALPDLDHKDDVISKIIKNSRFNKQLHTLVPRDYFFGKSVYAPTGIFYKKENVMKLGGFIIDLIACDDALFNEQYIMWFGMKRIDKVLALSGQGGNATSIYESGCRVVNDYYYYDLELAKKCKMPMKNIFISEMTYEKIKLHNVKMQDVKMPFDKNYPGSWKQKLYKILKRIYGYFYLIRM
jgi:glycosyltransferase involved in cell wall biosynthesis